MTQKELQIKLLNKLIDDYLNEPDAFQDYVDASIQQIDPGNTSLYEYAEKIQLTLACCLTRMRGDLKK